MSTESVRPPGDTPRAVQDADRGGPRRRKRPKLRWWQKLALLAFSVLLLVGLEMALRLGSYGPTVDFVVPRLDRGTERIMGINPEAYRRFHGRLQLNAAGGHLAPWREFVAPKPAGTFRVMFMGGSTVEGYPHAPNGCAPAFLEALLQDAWPDKHVEVINCGVTAVNTWSIREWTREVLAYEPDLLVIYAGHNEFYGGCGPASLNGAGTNRSRVLAQIWLRNLRITRALGDLIAAVRPAGSRPGGLLMEQLARDRTVPLHSDVYTGCRENFRANLEDIAHDASEADVPLVLCSLVSNEKDLVPMNSVHGGGLTDDEQKRWKVHFDAGVEAGKAGHWERALEALGAAARIDDSHAELIYQLAKANERLCAWDEARNLYRRARDLDALRFRATGEYSDVIRDVAEDHDAVFVDVLASFESASPHGLIGWNLMTDHLHPTLEGHYLMARAICEAMSGDESDSWPDIDAAALPACEPVAARLGNDTVSEMLSKMTVYKLTEGFPYANSPNAELHTRLEREILTWQNSLIGPLAIGNQNWSNSSARNSMHYHVGLAYLAEGEYEQAIVHLQRAVQRCEPHSMPAARAKCALAKAKLIAATSPQEEQSAHVYAGELRSWLTETASIHPDRKAEVEGLRRELIDTPADACD